MEKINEENHSRTVLYSILSENVMFIIRSHHPAATELSEIKVITIVQLFDKRFCFRFCLLIFEFVCNPIDWDKNRQKQNLLVLL